MSSLSRQPPPASPLAPADAVRCSDLVRAAVPALGLAGLLAILAAQAVRAWRYFPLFLGDQGWYLQVALRVSRGETLYRDLAWAYGLLPVQALAAAAVLAMQLAGLRQGALLYANDVRSINAGDVAAARWIAAHTPADALVAANDIGAIAYFGGRRIVDLVGLASPEVVAVTATSRPASADRQARLRDLLLAQGVTYVVMFPEWFPHLAADPALIEVTRFAVPRASALAHEQVVIYRLASSLSVSP